MQTRGSDKAVFRLDNSEEREERYGENETSAENVHRHEVVSPDSKRLQVPVVLFVTGRREEDMSARNESERQRSEEHCTYCAEQTSVSGTIQETESTERYSERT